MEPNVKTVMITGGFGYVGSRLTPLLLDSGYNVTVLDLCLYGEQGLDDLKKRSDWSELQNRLRFVKGDIRDPEAIQQALEGADAVIHLAAISNDPTGQMDEVLTKQVNFDAVGVLVKMAKQAGVKRFINASSSSVFGVKDESDIKEFLEPEPITYYSKYKALAEWIVKAAAADDFITTSIRPATICGYSPRQRFDLTVNKLTADGLTKKVITVHGGEQRRPNLAMTDMIQFYKHLLSADPKLVNGQVFNFGFQNMKVIEIAECIKGELSDLDVEIKVTDTLDKRDYHISSQKLLDRLHYQPVGSIEKEVANLRKAIEEKIIDDVDADTWYNMKCFSLERNNKPYEFLAN